MRVHTKNLLVPTVTSSTAPNLPVRLDSCVSNHALALVGGKELGVHAKGTHVVPNTFPTTVGSHVEESNIIIEFSIQTDPVHDGKRLHCRPSA